jgi:hypothetical protein
MPLIVVFDVIKCGGPLQNEKKIARKIRGPISQQDDPPCLYITSDEHSPKLRSSSQAM